MTNNNFYVTDNLPYLAPVLNLCTLFANRTTKTSESRCGRKADRKL